LSFKHLDPQARKVRQVLQAQLVQRVPQVLLVLLPPLLLEPSRRGRLLPSRTAVHRQPQSSTSYSPKVTRVTLATLVRQELQDQPPRSRLALQLQELRLPSPTLALRRLQSLTLFSCQVQLDQQDQPAQQALLALQPRLQLAQSRKAPLLR
jgi:hypothetical protein